MRRPTLVMVFAGAIIVGANAFGSLSAMAPALSVALSAVPSGDPGEFTPYGHRVFFAADSVGEGRELWITDGTEEGTVLVKDINPGEDSQGRKDDSWPQHLVVINDLLFFQAEDGVHGEELWVSDGTPAGTRLVKDIEPGSGASGPDLITEYNGLAYFIAGTAANGIELWKSDATEAGTQIAVELKAGAEDSTPSYLAKANGLLYFYAETSAPEGGLYKSNGTPAGTQQISPVQVWSEIVPAGGKLYFVSMPPTTDEELWITDGTPGGTHAILSYDPLVGRVREMTEFNGDLYFRCGGPSGSSGVWLWTSDGTEAGTQPVIDHALGLQDLFIMDEWLFFEGYRADVGIELFKWRSGQPEPTLVKDIFPGPDSGFMHYHVNPDRFHAEFTEVDGRLFFQANDGVHGMELWVTDGSTTGTYMVKDIASPDAGGTYGHAWWPALTARRDFEEFHSRLLFPANDGINNMQLWISDGTAYGTQMLKDTGPSIYDAEDWDGDGVSNGIERAFGSDLNDPDDTVETPAMGPWAMAALLALLSLGAVSALRRARKS